MKTTINKDAFLDLYRKNKTNREIAKDLGVTDYILRRWMRKNGYTSAYMQHRYVVRSRWMELYKKGKTDSEIAYESDEPINAIIMWRAKNNFKPNQDAAMEKRIKLYMSGLRDGEIAKHLGVDLHIIYEWRVNMEKRLHVLDKVTDTHILVFTALSNQKMNDLEIANRCGVSRSTVCRWRDMIKRKSNKY